MTGKFPGAGRMHSSKPCRPSHTAAKQQIERGRGFGYQPLKKRHTHLPRSIFIPPCRKIWPSTDTNPGHALAAGRNPWVAVERSDHVMVAISRACRSLNRPKESTYLFHSRVSRSAYLSHISHTIDIF